MKVARKRRRRVVFTYHWKVEVLCHPNEEKKMHDKLHRLMAQTVADFIGESVALKDCKTGHFQGRVRPRR